MDYLRYSDTFRSAWNGFVEISKNGYFPFHRDYLDYHSDRFQDNSLVVLGQDGALCAILPAHRIGNQLISHNGLTYGGFVTDRRMTTVQMKELFDGLLVHCREHNIHELIYKPVPHIYHILPAEEDLYALHCVGAQLVNRKVTSVISGPNRIPLAHRRKRGIKAAQKAHLSLKLSDNLAEYWTLLHEVLETRHRARPVHTLAEMEHLRQHFGNQIKLYGCWAETMIAGVLIYENQRVARAQYIASNAEGRRVGALDLLFNYLLEEIYPEKPFFELGTSYNPEDASLNEGLITFKEEWGGRAVVSDTYAIPCM